MISSSTQNVSLTDYTKLISDIVQPNIDNQSILSLVDYTFLETRPAPEKLKAFVDCAFQHQELAGICVYAHHLPLFKSHPSKKVTVINFPTGEQSDISVCGQFDAIMRVMNPDEIDYVFPYQSYLQGTHQHPLQQCRKIIECAQKTETTIKVIIESGAFESPSDIYQLCRSILEYPPDFIKTSTGFSDIGATFEAATTICQAIKDSNTDCGIKVSGGIKEALTACRYVHIAENILERSVEPSWFRIGTSSLVRALS